ncbi:hypothetical protein [Dyella sp. C9]|uniref:hypothetical protein n=1 Tax=Dyella sp. C9 TaxID=2202154 RepID=UPI00130044EE|nr:hypothetical protein [Dyella sp. C9]
MFAMVLLGGIAIGAAVVDQSWRRKLQGDPVFTPPNAEAAAFIGECRQHLRVYILSARPSGVSLDLPFAAANSGDESVLRHLGDMTCVVPIVRGMARLPGGREVDLRRGREIEEALASSYVAMGEAAAILVHYVTAHFRPQELEHSESSMFRSLAGKDPQYPMEVEIGRVARLLGADPRRIDGVVAGDRLWAQIDAWRHREDAAPPGAAPGPSGEDRHELAEAGTIAPV